VRCLAHERGIWCIWRLCLTGTLQLLKSMWCTYFSMFACFMCSVQLLEAVRVEVLALEGLNLYSTWEVWLRYRSLLTDRNISLNKITYLLQQCVPFQLHVSTSLPENTTVVMLQCKCWVTTIVFPGRLTAMTRLVLIFFLSFELWLQQLSVYHLFCFTKVRLLQDANFTS
jgi:hypothetical protein